MPSKWIYSNCLIHYAKTMKQFPIQSPAHRISVVKYLNFRLEMCSFGQHERKLCCQLCFMFCQQPNPSSSAVTGKIPDLHTGLDYLETNTNAFGLYALNTGLRFALVPTPSLFLQGLFLTDDISKCLDSSKFFSSLQKGRGGKGEHFHSGEEKPGHLVLLEALQFVIEQQAEVAAVLLPSACFQLPSSMLNFNYATVSLLTAISLPAWKEYRQMTKVRGCVSCRNKVT